jgi:hypothetical protein
VTPELLSLYYASGCPDATSGWAVEVEGLYVRRARLDPEHRERLTGVIHVQNKKTPEKGYGWFESLMPGFKITIK